MQKLFVSIGQRKEYHPHQAENAYLLDRFGKSIHSVADTAELVGCVVEGECCRVLGVKVPG